ncbi:helix-turn-helix transcriptional regulator [Leifsonia sp. WHRI 6310E]|uniref:helix-turn-helix domain-containing protein n=1 Tax=Leifsonia sp. WHRI 6310E TaxID=3162562 RepID=UPI0032EAD73F
MTMTNPSTALLEWDTADRIRKAMRVRDMGSQELADALYVSRNTISNWIGGRTTPAGPAMLGLASVLDVPLEWLKTGKAPSGDEAMTDESRPWESNPRPSHYE